MIRVQQQDFDAGLELSALSGENHGIGGVCAFIGLVRDLTGGEPAEPLDFMILEHYPGMTEKALLQIEAEAKKRWPLQETLIIHRYGKLLPGDRIVLAAAASSHRQAAFDACNFLIDWLKTKAPFWKLEQTKDGAKWVDGRHSDAKAAARWTNFSKG